jgi:hypothetical protein
MGIRSAALETCARGLTWAVSGTPLKTALPYNLIDQTVFLLAFRFLRDKLVVGVELSGWDVKIRSTLIWPVSLLAGMTAAASLMKLKGDPVTTGYMALALIASLAAKVGDAVLAEKAKAEKQA